MLCEIPRPRAPRNDAPPAWNGAAPNALDGPWWIQRISARAASTRNGATTRAANHPDASPTVLVPRRLSQVAPQIIASASTQPTHGPTSPRNRTAGGQVVELRAARGPTNLRRDRIRRGPGPRTAARPRRARGRRLPRAGDGPHRPGPGRAPHRRLARRASLAPLDAGG